MKKIDKDLKKLEETKIKVDAKAEQIRRIQENIKNAAIENLKSINQELKEIRSKLEPYINPSTKKERDEEYYNLKERYINLLQSRMELERTIIVVDESVTASKLHKIPGE